MRSLAVTIALAAAAILLGGAATWRMVKGDLGSLMGVPPTEPGERLYQNFRAGDVTKIQISTRNASAEFVKTTNGWDSVRPWRDRMNPEAATMIIAFTLGMRVEDAAPVQDVPQSEAGLSSDQAVAIRLEGADGRPLAKYRLGKRSPWLAAPIGEEETRNATVYVQPVDKHRKSHVFICSGDILPLFRNQLAFLRDHPHPRNTPSRLENHQTAGTPHQSGGRRVAHRKSRKTGRHFPNRSTRHPGGHATRRRNQHFTPRIQLGYPHRAGSARARLRRRP